MGCLLLPTYLLIKHSHADNVQRMTASSLKLKQCLKEKKKRNVMHGTHNYVTHTYTYIHALSAIVANAVKWAMVTARLEIYNLYISVKYTQLLTYIVMYVCTCVP